MLGSRALSDMPEESPRAPAPDTHPTSYSPTATGIAVASIENIAVQAVSDDLKSATDAVADGLCAVPIKSEQAADVLATSTRVARVAWAPRKMQVDGIGVVVDSDVTGDPADFVTFTLKRNSDGGAISSAIATPIATANQKLGARTLASFSWTGDIVLNAGDMLIVDVSKNGLGVALPKFLIVGNMRSI